MTSKNVKGRCGSDNLCINDSLSLNPTHRCAICKKIVHMICAQIINVTDRTECLKCVGMNEAMTMLVEPVTVPKRTRSEQK